MRATWMALGVIAALFLALFIPVLGWGIFPERNFVYRDAGHFYYPYFQQVQREWEAGRVPLWDPRDSGGMPLAANPTASAFYPLKLLFLLPYPTAYRWYLIGHVGFAALAAFLAARGLGLGAWGAGTAALAYGFGGFVFFQLYNVVFLVGAAWLPLVALAVDRLVRRPSAGWALGLGASLALMVLGGDPQAAYLAALAAIAYLVGFHSGARRGALHLLALAGVGFTLTQAGIWWPRLVLAWRDHADPLAPLRSAPARIGLWAVIALVAFGWLFRSRRLFLGHRPFVRSASLLVAAGVVAALLAAVQILPTLELVRQTDRAAPEAPHEPVAFSFFPARTIELFFPNFFGPQLPVHGRWLGWDRLEGGIWFPSLYFGLIPALLALGSFRLFRGDPTVRWLTWVTIIAFWLSLGKFGGAGWLLELSTGASEAASVVASQSGTNASAGLYRVAEAVFPGFRSFRYPSKLMVLVSLGMALLAGHGMERWLDGKWNGLSPALFGGGLFAGALAAALVWGRGDVESWLDARGKGSISSFGPFDTGAAWRGMAGSIAQFALVASLAGGFGFWGTRRGWNRHLLGGAFLVLIAADLFWADRRWILTDAQAAIDAKPALLSVIETAEAEERAASPATGTPQPYRVHRTRIYHPPRWNVHSNEERVVEMSRWERKTLQPKYGVPWGVDYATTVGTMSLYDVEFFFAPWTVRTPPQLARVQPGARETVYYPRQAFNLWNTKYFILPKWIKLDDEDRGVLTLLADADGTPCPVLAQSPAEEEDYLVLRNLEAFPRAWLVHQADFRAPLVGLSRRDRKLPMEQLLFRDRDGGARLWEGVEHGEYPLRTVAMIETDAPEHFARYAAGAPNNADERVFFEAHDSDRVSLSVRAQAPGFVIVADTFYPGWSATVDGAPAPILRANRAMRGIPIEAGEHRIEMRYESRPWRIGAALSGGGWLAWLVLMGVWGPRPWKPGKVVSIGPSNRS